MNQLNSVLLEGVLVIKDPDALVIRHDGQYFRVVTDHDVTFSIGENLRIVGKLVNPGVVTVIGNFIEALKKTPSKSTDVQWHDNYIFEDPEGFWFVTEDEAVIGPYKTCELAKTAFDAYVKTI